MSKTKSRTTKEFTEEVSQKLDLPKSEVKRITDVILTQIVEMVEADGKLSVCNRVFKLKVSSPRACVNPRTGEKIQTEGGKRKIVMKLL